MSKNITKVFSDNNIKVRIDDDTYSFGNDDGVGDYEEYFYDILSQSELLRYLIEEDAQLINIRLTMKVIAYSSDTELVDSISDKLSTKYTPEPSEVSIILGENEESEFYVHYSLDNIQTMLSKTYNRINEHREAIANFVY